MTNEAAPEPFTRISVADLPNQSIRLRKNALPQDTDLLILSEDGKRGEEMCRVAASLGLGNLFNIEGGFAAWEAAGYDIETISEGVASPPR
jgi:rhodanese-related sulfurtransferase